MYDFGKTDSLFIGLTNSILFGNGLKNSWWIKNQYLKKTPREKSLGVKFFKNLYSNKYL